MGFNLSGRALDRAIERVNEAYGPEFKALREQYDSGRISYEEWEVLLEPLRNAWEDEIDEETGYKPERRVMLRQLRATRDQCRACGRPWREGDR